MKGVILAAGYGSRFLPASKTIPKELFPLLDKPAIAFIVEEFIQAGIEQLIVVTSRRKKPLDDFFDREIELEQALTGEKRKCIIPPQLDVCLLHQQRMLGSGDALMQLEAWVGKEAFVVAYPDDIHMDGPSLTAQLMAVHQRSQRSVLSLQETPGDISRYGVAVVKSQHGVQLVTQLVEKPPQGKEPSRLVSYGRYLYTSEIFSALKQTRAYFSGSGEFTQTQAIQQLATEGRMAAVTFEGRILDVGEPAGYLKSIIAYALTRPDLKEELLHFIKEVSARHN